MQRRTKLALLFFLLASCWVVAWRSGGDLASLHALARSVYEGQLDRLYAHAAGNPSSALAHGPLSLVLLEPLGALPAAAMKWIWISLQTISFVIAWFTLSRLYPVLRDPTLRWGWLLVWMVSINPIYGNFQDGHGLLMLTAVLLLAELLSQTDHPVPQALGGALAAVAGGIEIFPLFIAAYYFVARPKAARYGVLLGFIASIAVPFAVFGVTDAPALSRDFFARTFSTPTPIASALVGGLFLLFAFKAARAKYLRVERADTHWWALAMVLCVFLGPNLRAPYFILFLPAFCSLLELAYLRLSGALVTWATVVSAALIVLTTDGVWGKPVSDALARWHLPTVAIALLCAALALALSRGRVLYVR